MKKISSKVFIIAKQRKPIYNKEKLVKRTENTKTMFSYDDRKL